MNKFLKALVTCCSAGLLSVDALSTVIHPEANEWYAFDVDSLIAQDAGLGWIDAQLDMEKGYQGDGSALSFEFSLVKSSFITIVDAGIAGDEFGILLNGITYTTTDVEAQSDVYAGIDFDTAWTDPAFSHLTLFLGAGSYSLTGFLHQSALDLDGFEFNSTVGGLKIVEADEPGSLALLVLLFAGLFIRHRISGVGQLKGVNA